MHRWHGHQLAQQSLPRRVLVHPLRLHVYCHLGVILYVLSSYMFTFPGHGPPYSICPFVRHVHLLRSLAALFFISFRPTCSPSQVIGRLILYALSSYMFTYISPFSHISTLTATFFSPYFPPVASSAFPPFPSHFSFSECEVPWCVFIHNIIIIVAAPKPNWKWWPN